MKTYFATGFVWGHAWGGGKGGYQAKPLNGYESEEALIKKAEEMLKDGTLDGGFGFECLIGAFLTITEIDTIEKDGKEYSHEEEHCVTLGDVPNEMIERWYGL